MQNSNSPKQEAKTSVVLENKPEQPSILMNKVVKIVRNRGRNSKHFNRLGTLSVTCTYAPGKNRNGDYLLGATKEQLAQYQNIEPVVWDHIKNCWVYNEKFFNSYRVTLTDSGLTLNLNNEQDNFIYRVLAYGNFNNLALNPTDLDVLGSDILFYLLDKDEVAKTSVMSIDKKAESYFILRSMSANDMIRAMAMYNMPTQDTSFYIAKAELSNQIEKDSSKFLEYFGAENNVRTNITILFRISMEKGYIKYDNNIRKYILNIDGQEPQTFASSEKESIDMIMDKKYDAVRARLANLTE